MNDWYKNGKLPPIGAEVWAENIIGVVVALPDAGNAMVCVKRHDGWLGLYNYKRLKPFRTLRTETDKLVEQAKAICKSWTYSCGKSIPELFVEANWRPIKPMTEDEFVTDIQRFIKSFKGRTDWAEILYRSGCRFVEQGEHNE